MPEPPTAEHRRLADSQAHHADWKNWGPYVAERAWGTVREDYSPAADAWDYFPHDHARSRAYRWNEDGLGGFCNRFQNLCMALALWNGRDPILKERLFGLSGHEGNHGEDVKEYYFYLDACPVIPTCGCSTSTPGRVSLRPAARGDRRPEPGTGVRALRRDRRRLPAGRYFDVFIEYAKVDEEDILCRITAVNRGPDRPTLHILPHLWFRNSWSWGYSDERPELRAEGALRPGRHKHLGERWWYLDGGPLVPSS